MDFRKYLLIGFGLLAFLQGWAQSGSIRQIEKKMEEGSWGKSRQMIARLLDKDSLNLEARLILSRWFLRPENPDYQLDSAYRQVTRSLSRYKNLPPRLKEKYKKENADSVAFARAFDNIDSLAFKQAKSTNTEAAYQHFLSYFPASAHRVQAEELRDEIAYVSALQVNSYAAFADYLKKYPQSARKKDAASRYERLLFEDRTKDKKLLSYEVFASEFPQSPFREEAIKNIFLIKTASGAPADFQNFISKYSTTAWAARAQSLMYYVSLETDDPQHPHIEADSIVQLRKLHTETWAPIYKDGKYGFVNEKGAERCAPRFTFISPDYFCGGIKDEILSTSEGLIKRNSKIIFKPSRQVKDIGLGFLVAGDSVSKTLLHKSGMILLEGIEEAHPLDAHFLVVAKGDARCLMALNGRILIPFFKQTIEMMEGVIVVNRYGKNILFKTDQVVAAADGAPLKEEWVFDEARSAGHHLLLVRNGALEGLVNEKVEFVVPLGRQGLQPTSVGLMRRTEDYFTLSDLNAEIAEQRWQKYKLERQWLLLQNGPTIWLVDIHTKKVIEKTADSLWVSEGIAFAKAKDSIRVYINSNTHLALPAASSVSLVKSQDSIRYFYNQQKGRKTIYDIKSGEKKLTLEGDQVESIGTDFFLVSRKGKKGLLSKAGKILLPFEYDAMLVKKDFVTLLKEKKFGLYHIPTSRLIKPAFGCNLNSLDSAFLIACKNDLYGIIDWTSQPLTPFEYNEIRSWGKHTIWGRKNFEWTLFNYLTGKVILSRIKNFWPIRENAEETVAIVQQENHFGVVSNVHGVIIPPSFSFVANVGSAEHPLYFTSKEVEEAGIFVVIYYTEAGQFLRKEVYEDDEYEKIVCKED